MGNVIKVSSSGKLEWGSRKFRCALGRSSVTDDKREGDGATPVGCFKMRKVYYRADKLDEPETVLPVQVLTKEDAWCDNPSHSEYNTFVKLPHSGSHEKLWREDEVYDIIVPLGYNDDPPTPGKGSAIFMHIARKEYTPTEGCVALSLKDLLGLLKEIDADTEVCIKK